MIHPEATPFVTSFHMHATACAEPGVHLCEPFSPLGGAPPRFSPCSLFFFPLFFPRVCHLVLASPLTNPPVCMQFLEHTHGAQCPCNCAAVALLTRVLWSRPRGPLFQPGHSDPPAPRGSVLASHATWSRMGHCLATERCIPFLFQFDGASPL